MTDTLRLGVIGVGHLGHFHAQKYAALCRERPGLTLVGVADISAEQAEKVASEMVLKQALEQELRRAWVPVYFVRSGQH